jgi:hypothetical protein
MEFATIHRLRCPGVPNATCVVVRCRFFKRCGLIAVDFEAKPTAG